MKIYRYRIKGKRLKLHKMFKVLTIKKSFFIHILLNNYHVIQYLHFSDEESKAQRVTP